MSLVLGAVVADASAVPARGPVPGKFIIKFKDHTRAELAAKALSDGQKLARFSRLKVRSSLAGSNVFDSYYQFHDSTAGLSAAQVKEILGEENVASVEPDYYLEFFDYPTDDLFSNQWYLLNTGQAYIGIERNDGFNNDRLITRTGTPGADIDIGPVYVLPPAETTRVVVAIVDSGTDLVHPELADRYWRNPDEIPGNGADDDRNGFVDDTLGYDISGDIQTLFDPVGDNDPSDSHGHGTHIAGIIGASADGVGVVGIAPFVEIMPVKIRPNATVAVGAAGIVYAVNAGARIINISWGTPFESGILQEAIRFARLNGVFVAIAPGNTGDNQRYYPAGYDSTFVVAAGNSDGYQETWSTYGGHIDIVAPGRDILSLRAAGTDMYAEAGEPGVRIIGDDSLYYLADGTSMATPVVAGAAALIFGMRPDLTLESLEEILLYGADDLVDPWNVGDTLVGPDTISGFGYIDVLASLQLLQQGGIHIVSPVRRNRYTGDIPVRIASIAGYTGGWRLDYCVGLDSEQWQFLATGSEVPSDSLVYTFSDTNAEGYLRFRVTDKYGTESFVNCVYVRGRSLQITRPSEGQIVKYSTPIVGNAYGLDFDSMKVFSRKGTGGLSVLTRSTGEFFDSIMFDWAVSGVDTGSFTLLLHGYYGSETLIDSVGVTVLSAFASGWPRYIGGFGAITPVCEDLDNDGLKELVIASSNGLLVFEATGQVKTGFPVMLNKNMRCVPAVYDLDRDGDKEIIATNEDGIYVFHHDGSVADGWPALCYTGLIPYGYGFPNPTVTRLGIDEDSAIVIINRLGQILAYEFNGDPYFYSLGGLFASLDPRIADFYSYGGFTSPFVSGTDVDGDGLQEVVTSYSSPYPYSGLALFDGRTGRPAFDEMSPIRQTIPDVSGTTLADLDGDQLPEVICLGRDSLDIPWIWVKKHGRFDLAGWPRNLPAVQTWIASYPVVADLNLDGVPEILCTFFEYDVASLYIFNADGTAYLDRDGRPYGEAFSDLVTFGTPAVADLTGDEYPEIAFRAGHILPGTGPEKLYLLNHLASPVAGWPVSTPARSGKVLSSRYAPLIDDLDNDNLVELILVSDDQSLLVWDFEAEYQDGRNRYKFLSDNINSGMVRLTGPGTDVDDSPPALPERMALSQNFPNPFNAATTIEFSLDRRSPVSLVVFNILGQEVATLVDEVRDPGTFRESFDASTRATGLYLYRLTVGETTLTRKMMLIK